MANRETFPANQSPLTGDISGPAGATSVTVTGLQQVPFQAGPYQDGQIAIYNAAANQWLVGDPVVSGPNAVGTAPSRPPVQIAGVDPTGLVQEIQTDTAGGIQESAEMRDLLRDILNQLKALTRAVVNLDSQANDADYVADQFDNADPMA